MMPLPRLAAASLFLFSVSAAGAAERTIIVLDASGSMWGQIDGKPKLEIARETLSTVLQTIPADTELGLMAYGHRQRGQCSDIELIVEPAAGTGPAIADAVARMRFLGKTPLSEAVRQAAVALRHTEEKATVVLITDGIETCEADPCALGRELEETGVDFTAHVVGFGLSREEGRQVACLAENTGGRYIQASDAEGLAEALTQTVAAGPAETPQAEAAEPEPVVLPEATVTTEVAPTIGQTFQASWTGPADAGDYIDIVPAGQEETNGELSYTWVGQAPQLPIRAPGEPGAYDLRYVWQGPDRRHVLATTRIEVGDAENALVAPASVPIGSVVEVEWKGPGQQDDYIDIVPADYTETSGELSYVYVGADNPTRLTAPGRVGTYQLRYILAAPEGRKILVSTPLEVTEAEVTLAFEPAAGAGEDMAIHWTGPATEGDYIDLVAADHTETNGELTYAYVTSASDGETVILRTPGDAGRYQIRYILQAPDGRRVMAALPLEVTPADVSLSAPETVEPGGSIDVEWNGPGSSGDYVDIVRADHTETSGELAYFWANRNDESRTGQLTAPEKPGAYRIRYIMQASGGRRVGASVPLTVR